MKDLLAKAKEYASGFVKVVGEKLGVMNGIIKVIIIGFLTVVVLLVATFYGAWLYLLSKGQAALGDLLNLIDRVISPQMVAFITFIATCFVDKDSDGIPDKFEEEADDDNKKRGDRR